MQSRRREWHYFIFYMRELILETYRQGDIVARKTHDLLRKKHRVQDLFKRCDLQYKAIKFEAKRKGGRIWVDKQAKLM
jgi:hypothetical protein